MITLVSGIALGLISFYLDWNKVSWNKTFQADFMLMAFLLFVLCVLIMVATTLLFPEPFKAVAKPLVWEDWREPLRNSTGGRGLMDYRGYFGMRDSETTAALRVGYRPENRPGGALRGFARARLAGREQHDQVLPYPELFYP